MKIVFVSNYINHHQIPFGNAMHKLLEGNFTFVQTEPMERERVQMGWNAAQLPVYVKCYYEEPDCCRQLILDADVVIFGGTDEESYIQERLQAGKPIVRYSERLYKTGQWKAISPRGLRKKYLDHTRYRKAPVYLLCSGAYVASDFHIVRAYSGKMFCWGYFPETKHYDIEVLLDHKGTPHAENVAADSTTDAPNMPASVKERIPHLLWAGRMIDWKHPELAVETARHLKEKGLPFHMDIIGGGELYPQMEAMVAEYGLQDMVHFLGYQAPENVRRYMEQADIYLFTSDRQEGWGAVANEAMNSGCALVANHMIGAVPYLVKSGKNGYIYQDGNQEQLFTLAEALAGDLELCRKLGRNAYETIVNVWNAENAAESLLQLIRTRVLAEEAAPTGKRGSAGNQAPDAAADPTSSLKASHTSLTPCAPAPILSECAAKKLAKAMPMANVTDNKTTRNI